MAAEVLYRDLITTQDVKGSMAATPDRSTAKSGHIRTPRLMISAVVHYRESVVVIAGGNQNAV